MSASHLKAKAFALALVGIMATALAHFAHFLLTS
jgi:hypothetical protein